MHTMQEATEMADNQRQKEIYLAGGCFWGLEAYMKKLPGVTRTEVGYAGGSMENPDYEAVCSGRTGHAETVRVCYAPGEMDLATLLEAYLRVVDPTSVNRQGNDRGSQYRTGIYYTDEAERPVIQAALAAEQRRYQAPIVTEVAPLVRFYPAEDYHQCYLDKNPGGYCHIHLGAAEDFIKEKQLEGSETRRQILQERYVAPPKDVLKKQLTDIQFRVTQNGDTERPYRNEYDDHFAQGLYVDVVTGEPLFTSMDKFASGCGWPSFSKPILPEVVREYQDTSFHMQRTEVRSRSGDSHLGHVFPDGPKEAGGQRYCINSAALRFIPVSDLEKEGYGYLRALFA